jgi:hypothetical protein
MTGLLTTAPQGYQQVRNLPTRKPQKGGRHTETVGAEGVLVITAHTSELELWVV